MPKTDEKVKMVDVFIPKGADRNEQGLYVAVNGIAYILPRGKTSTVPDYVAERIAFANERADALDKWISNNANSAKAQ